MKRFNIGLETKFGESVGFIVTAANGCDAEGKARTKAKDLAVPLMPGSLRQRRDERPEANNSYFDGSYRLLAEVE